MEGTKGTTFRWHVNLNGSPFLKNENKIETTATTITTTVNCCCAGAVWSRWIIVHHHRYHRYHHHLVVANTFWFDSIWKISLPFLRRASIASHSEINTPNVIRSQREREREKEYIGIRRKKRRRGEATNIIYNGRRHNTAAATAGSFPLRLVTLSIPRRRHSFGRLRFSLLLRFVRFHCCDSWMREKAEFLFLLLYTFIYTNTIYI